MRNYRNYIVALSICLFMLAGCGEGSSIRNPFSSSPAPTIDDVYNSAFADITIPVLMKEVVKYTAVAQNPDGTSSGAQIFEGSAEALSLMETMVYNMRRSGWAVRGMFRSQRSVLIFEKGNLNAMVAITDGDFKTRMELWVTQIVKGDIKFGSGSSNSGGYNSGGNSGGYNSGGGGLSVAPADE